MATTCTRSTGSICSGRIPTVAASSTAAPAVLRIGSAGVVLPTGSTPPSTAPAGSSAALKDIALPQTDKAFDGFLPPSPWDDKPAAKPGTAEAITRIKQAVKMMTTLKLKPGHSSYAHRNKGGSLWAGRYCWHYAWMVYRYANMHFKEGQNNSKHDKQGPYGRDVSAKRRRKEIAPRGYHGLKRKQFLIQKADDTRLTKKRYRSYRGKFLACPREGMGPSAYDQIMPGDWLYLFNNNTSVGGAHSVIFLHWGGTYKGKTYDATEGRKQLIFTEASQYTPWRGGKVVSHQFNDRLWLNYILR